MSTSWFKAAENGDLGTIKILIEHENINGTLGGSTALHYACSRGNMEVVKYLLEHKYWMDIEAEDQYGRTALHVASLNGYPEIVQYLLDKRANIKAQDSLGRTPLHAACIAGHKEVVKCLIDNDAPCDLVDNLGQLPSGTEYAEICQLLEGFRCTICLGNESDGEYMVLQCEHKFCQVCILTWIQRSSRCPLCRQDISYLHDI